MSSTLPSSLSLTSRSSLCPKATQRQRDRAGASIEGEHPTPSRIARKLILPSSLPASAGTVSQSPTENSLNPRTAACPQSPLKLPNEQEQPVTSPKKFTPQ